MYYFGEIKELKEKAKEKKRKLCLIGVGARRYKIGRVNYIVSARFKVFEHFLEQACVISLLTA